MYELSAGSRELFGEFTDIEMELEVYEYNSVIDWSDDTPSNGTVAEETLHIYPCGEEDAARYVRRAQDSDVDVFENDQVSITSIGWSFEDGILTYQAYLENKTDMEVVYSLSESSVNGMPIWESWGIRLQSKPEKQDISQWSGAALNCRILA